jgi:hypothetical protein
MTLYRVFVDEVGNHDMKSCDKPTEQYLCVTGAIMQLAYEQGPLTESMSAIKTATFGATDIVLHRRDIVERNPPFHVLKNANTQEPFDAALMKLLEEADYQVFTRSYRQKGAREPLHALVVSSLSLLPYGSTRTLCSMRTNRKYRRCAGGIER